MCNKINQFEVLNLMSFDECINIYWFNHHHHCLVMFYEMRLQKYITNKSTKSRLEYLGFEIFIFHSI